MQLHKKQREIARSRARFKVIRAGRRSGKTTYEVESLLYKAVSGKNRTVFYIAPNQTQARAIIWEALKKRLGKIGDPHEQRLEVRVPTQEGGHSLIKIAGWETRENFRGQSAYHITFDETDTMKDFFIGWQEIFRPALIDTGGTADFIGTPKKENPNLRRLEKQAETDTEWQAFHFTSWDNPNLPKSELQDAQKEMDGNTYRQEIMAEYVDNLGSLFRYTSLVDMFTNTAEDDQTPYLLVDIADDGMDSTVFSFWRGLECYQIEQHERLNTETIITRIREVAKEHRIPYSHIAVDAIGVGAGVASSSLLDGIIGFKSSLQAMKTDLDPVRLPGVHYAEHAPLTTDYKNLRSQCIFELARLVNDHKIAVTVDDVRIREHIIEELSTYQDDSSGDGKRMATKKDRVKELIGRSPDLSDPMIMRMYFVIRDKLLPEQSEEALRVYNELQAQFDRNENNMNNQSTR